MRSSAVFAFEVRFAGDGGVEVGDVGVVVLAMVDLHGLGVDDGFEGGGLIGQGRKREGHDGISNQKGNRFARVRRRVTA